MENKSVTESENCTPRHQYNTRLQAKYSNSFLSSESPFISTRELLKRTKNSKNFLKEITKPDFSSTKALLPCTKEDTVLILTKQIMDWQQRSNVPCPGVCSLNPRAPCGTKSFLTRYGFKTVKYVSIAAFFGMVVLPIVSTIVSEFLKMGDDMTNLKNELVDTKTRLQQIETTLNQMKRGQYNIKAMVHDEIDRLSSDKTGRTDFAMESAGGSIYNLMPNTENYRKPNNLFGVTLCETSHGPSAMLQTGSLPGQCWAFSGSSGGAIIRLLGVVKIDSVSLEHIPKHMSPTGDLKTAPKDFIVTALKSLDDQGQYLGQFSYDTKGPALQTFKVKTSIPVRYVSFRVLSNHGHPDFTCVYRFRVHGSLDEGLSENRI